MIFEIVLNLFHRVRHFEARLLDLAKLKIVMWATFSGLSSKSARDWVILSASGTQNSEKSEIY